MLLMVQGRTERMETEEGGREREEDIMSRHREGGKSEGDWKGGKKGIWGGGTGEGGGVNYGIKHNLTSPFLGLAHSHLSNQLTTRNIVGDKSRYRRRIIREV